jgi:transposase
MNIKEKIQAEGLCQWEIAEEMNMSEFTLSRWLRRPEKLSYQTIERINKAIQLIKMKKGRGYEE